MNSTTATETVSSLPMCIQWIAAGSTFFAAVFTLIALIFAYKAYNSWKKQMKTKVVYDEARELFLMLRDIENDFFWQRANIIRMKRNENSLHSLSQQHSINAQDQLMWEFYQNQIDNAREDTVRFERKINSLVTQWDSLHLAKSDIIDDSCYAELKAHFDELLELLMLLRLAEMTDAFNESGLEKIRKSLKGFMRKLEKVIGTLENRLQTIINDCTS